MQKKWKFILQAQCPINVTQALCTNSMLATWGLKTDYTSSAIGKLYLYFTI